MDASSRVRRCDSRKLPNARCSTTSAAAPAAALWLSSRAVLPAELPGGEGTDTHVDHRADVAAPRDRQPNAAGCWFRSLLAWTHLRCTCSAQGSDGSLATAALRCLFRVVLCARPSPAHSSDADRASRGSARSQTIRALVIAAAPRSPCCTGPPPSLQPHCYPSLTVALFKFISLFHPFQPRAYG